MILKSYNYKAVPLNPNSRGNNEVTHDFPEEYIVSMNDIVLNNRDETIGALKRSYLYMDKTDYNYIKPVIIWPTYTLNVIDGSDYEGAFVWPTQPGVYKYIGGLDFASLYPSTMIQFQISPESFLFKDPTYIPKANEIKTVSGAVYQKRPDAILPAILSHYFAKRKAAKGDRKTVDTDMEFLIRKYEERFGKFE